MGARMNAMVTKEWKRWIRDISSKYVECVYVLVKIRSEEIVRIHSLNFSIVNADDSITQLTKNRVEQCGMILHFWRYWLQSANGRPNSKYYSYSWITSCPLSVVGICKYDEISLPWLCYII